MERPSRSREDIVAAIEGNRQQEQANLLAKVEAIEATHGVPYERLTALYGDNVLNPARAESKNIDRWHKLCDTLATTDKAMVALVGFRQEPIFACHGFGQEPQYETHASVIVVSNPHDAKITFGDGARTTRAFIEGSGYQLVQPGGLRTVEPRFDNLAEEPQPIKEVIASNGGGFDADYGDNLDVVVAGDTYNELSNAIEDACFNMTHVRPTLSNTVYLDKALMTLRYADLNTRRAAKRAAEAEQ